MQQKKLTLFIVVLFLLSSVYLLTIGSKFATPDFGSNWWNVYFINPKDLSLDFAIENYGDNNKFHYIILADREKIKEADIQVDKNEQKTIEPDVNATSGKITIEVTQTTDKKDIYKNF